MENIKELEHKISSIYEMSKELTKFGKVADYIPELSVADPNKLGFYMVGEEVNELGIGDYNDKFTIQSVSKVIIFICAVLDNDIDYVLSKVSQEPSSSAFNSIADLELKNEFLPLNPYLNSGAIVCTSLLKGKTSEDKVNQVINMIKKMSGNDEITYDEKVYQSESDTGSRNRALAYYMASNGILDGDVEQTLDAYFKICSILVTCKDLAKMALVLAKDGYSKECDETLFSRSLARRARTIMAVCGMYDGSGEFAVNVGLPSKSGVGGGIMSISTTHNGIGIGVYGPSLDEKGNSIGGVKLLQTISEGLDLSIF